MGKLIDLSKARHDRKRGYLKAHEYLLNQFFSRFVGNNFRVDYASISGRYMELRYQQNEMAWDYIDFREELKEAISLTYGEVMWLELQKQYWFDSRWMSRDEMTDRCTSFFILGESHAAKSMTDGA